jgi:hypothetical protein
MRSSSSRAAVALRVALEVAEEALVYRIRLPPGRCRRARTSIEHFAHGFVDREEVDAVTAPHLHAEGLGAAGDVLLRADGVVDAGVLAE